jgi:hypothetical protein
MKLSNCPNSTEHDLQTTHIGTRMSQRSTSPVRLLSLSLASHLKSVHGATSKQVCLEHMWDRMVKSPLGLGWWSPPPESVIVTCPTAAKDQWCWDQNHHHRWSLKHGVPHPTHRRPMCDKNKLDIILIIQRLKSKMKNLFRWRCITCTINGTVRLRSSRYAMPRVLQSTCVCSPNRRSQVKHYYNFSYY